MVAVLKRWETMSQLNTPFFPTSCNLLAEDDFVLLLPVVDIIKTNKGAILYNKTRERLLFITQTQAYVCSLCDGTHTIKEIANKVSENYNVNIEVALEDVLFFLKSLLKSEILVVLPVKVPKKLGFDECFLYEVNEKADVIMSKKITTIGINITDQCQLKCIYCFANSSPKRKMKMQTGDIVDILKEGRKLGAESVYFGGGEPLLHDELPHIVRMAYKLGYGFVEISTKAVTIDSYEKARALRNAGLTKIQVSIDSCSSSIYDILVGTKNMYPKMIAGLYYLIKAEIEVHIRSTLNKYNVKEIIPLIRFFSKFGIRQFRIASVTPVGRASLPLVPSPEDLIWLERELEKMRQKHKDLHARLAYDKVGDVTNCGGCLLSIYIHTNGDVTFCDVAGELRHKYPVLNLGNIRNNSLEEILHSEKVVNLQMRRMNNNICKFCPRKCQCRGGCVVRSCAFFKTPYVPDPLCEKVYSNCFGKAGEPFLWIGKIRGELLT